MKMNSSERSKIKETNEKQQKKKNKSKKQKHTQKKKNGKQRLNRRLRKKKTENTTEKKQQNWKIENTDPPEDSTEDSIPDSIMHCFPCVLQRSADFPCFSFKIGISQPSFLLFCF